jgi:hypothetical protein
MALIRVTVQATYVGYVCVNDCWRPGMRMEPADALEMIELPENDQCRVKSVNSVHAVCVDPNEIVAGCREPSS